MASDFIPNSYQTPNAYVDKFMAYLTPEEWMVLSYFVRRIFGFNKRQDNIAYSQVMNGITTKGGEQLDAGTGLGMTAVKNAIRNLKYFNLIVEVAPNNAHQNKGPLYALQLDSELVNLQAIKDRKAEVERKHAAKMSKARQSIRPPSSEQTPINPLEGPPINPLEGPPPLSNSGDNNQGNPDRKPEYAFYAVFFDALMRLCQLDPKLKASQIGKTAKKLEKAGYLPEDVEYFSKWWSEGDWRGQRGKPPTLNQVEDMILQSKQDYAKRFPSAQTKRTVLVKMDDGTILEATI